MSGTDDELERLLRNYRVSDPPADLRNRIVAQASRRSPERLALQTIIDWLPAAAAVIIATVFYWLAAVERQHLEARIPPVPLQESVAIDLEPSL